MASPSAAAGGSRLLEYCLAGRHAIEGWLQDDALLLTLALHRAQRAAGIAGGVAEIGVHHGKFFVALALLCDGEERALAVDVFADQHLNPDGSGHGDRAVFDANLARWGVSPLAVTRQGDSLTLTPAEVRGALGGGVRLWSVDGSHALRHAANDLRVAAASLAPGGVALLDDFLDPGWLGVTEAAVLMLHGEEPPPLAPLAMCGGKLAMVAPADHPAWMERLAGGLLLPMAREAERARFCGWDFWRLWPRQGEGGWALWGHPPLAALDLASPEPPRGGTVGAGWSYAEEWGRWTAAERAECAVALPAAGPAPRRLALQIGTLLAEPGEERRVRVAVGPAGAERPLPPLALREEAMRWHVLDLPAPLPAAGGALPIAVECGPLRSPAALGRCPDPRNIGVGLSSALLLA